MGRPRCLQPWTEGVRCVGATRLSRGLEVLLEKVSSGEYVYTSFFKDERGLDYSV